MIISTISSRDVGAGVRLGEVVFGIVEVMFAFYRHQVVVLDFFYHCRGEKMVSITGNWSGQRLVAAGCNAPSWGINHSEGSAGCQEKTMLCHHFLSHQRNTSARESPFRLRLKNSGLCVALCRR